jgi:hypothetical protein
LKASDIRNDIVHNEGKVQRNETKRYVRNKSAYLELDHLGGIKINKGFLSLILKEIDALFDDISKEMPRRMGPFKTTTKTRRDCQLPSKPHTPMREVTR